MHDPDSEVHITVELLVGGGVQQRRRVAELSSGPLREARMDTEGHATTYLWLLHLFKSHAWNLGFSIAVYT